MRAHVLIVCEDDKAEPNYLCGLCREHRLTNAVVIEGGAGDPTNLLTVAQGKEFQDFDTVWCVFDRDSWPADDFDNAVRRCTGRLRGAWSNEAFELWYVLHFDYLNTATAGHGGRVRDHYQNRLKALLGTTRRTRSTCGTVFDRSTRPPVGTHASFSGSTTHPRRRTRAAR